MALVFAVAQAVTIGAFYVPLAIVATAYEIKRAESAR